MTKKKMLYFRHNLNKFNLLVKEIKIMIIHLFFNDLKINEDW